MSKLEIFDFALAFLKYSTLGEDMGALNRFSTWVEWSHYSLDPHKPNLALSLYKPCCPK